MLLLVLVLVRGVVEVLVACGLAVRGVALDAVVLVEEVVVRRVGVAVAVAVAALGELAVAVAVVRLAALKVELAVADLGVLVGFDAAGAVEVAVVFAVVGGFGVVGEEDDDRVDGAAASREDDGVRVTGVFGGCFDGVAACVDAARFGVAVALVAVVVPSAALRAVEAEPLLCGAVALPLALLAPLGTSASASTSVTVLGAECGDEGVELSKCDTRRRCSRSQCGFSFSRSITSM